MKFRSVVIVTYGRSGSTLLQGVLNSIPGCLVRGENYNFCVGLYDSYSAYQRAWNERKTDQSTLSPSSPWYGASQLDTERYLNDLRAAVRSHLLLGRPQGERLQCIGFKEVRYLSHEMASRDPAMPYAEYLHGYLDFLKLLLPDLAIVFLTREHAQVTRSAWWKNTPPEQVLALLTEFEDAVHSYAKRREHCFFIDYGAVVANGAALASLFNALGAEHDPQRVAQVLEQPHSYAIQPVAVSVPVATGLQLQVYDDTPGVALVKIDPLPAQLPQGRRFHLGGVVVVPEAGAGELGLRDDEGRDMPLTWSLPSPVVGAKLPHLPQAQTARFRCQNVPVTPGATYHLVLRRAQPAEELQLASLRLRAVGEA